MNTTRITSFNKKGRGKISCISTELVSGSIPKEVPEAKVRVAQWGIEYLSQTFFKLFQDNEFRAYHKARSKKELIDQIKEVHRSNVSLIKKFTKGTYTIGTFRKKFNSRTLFLEQPKTYLVSFEYNDRGFIVAGGFNPRAIMMFEDCVWKCKTLCIADPRFIPPEQIVALRNKQLQNEFVEWEVPNEEDIRNIRLEINKHIDPANRLRTNKQVYDSVHFEMGYTRLETPQEFEPFEF